MCSDRQQFDASYHMEDICTGYFYEITYKQKEDGFHFLFTFQKHLLAEGSCTL